MTAPRPKRLEYAAEVGRDGSFAPAGREPIAVGEGWAAEHLVLAGLVRCALTSLAHHARRAGVALSAGGSARGVVTKRDSDGRYAFVDVSCRIDAALEPEPEADDVATLLARAEHGCFVGASLTAPPAYSWIVNGVER